MLRTIVPKKPPKDQRERQVLLGLIELYLELGKPVGSNTLRENGFEHLSSATIRNYFAKLEEQGYLKQQHSSGGRIPTHLAYKLYAEAHLNISTVDEREKKFLIQKLSRETRETASFLQHAAEVLSEATGCAVFLSSPRFDQDFVLDIKLVSIDNHRCLCVLITDFGLVHTEILFIGKKLSNFSLKRIESYFRSRITGQSNSSLSREEEQIAARLYREIMLRHIVSYTHFSLDDIYKTGFSRLLTYPDFNNALALANGLSIFENPNSLRSLLSECSQANHLSCWIGDDLHSIAPNATACSVIAVPYKIHQATVGAIALLGPNRIPYRRLFGLLQIVSGCVSDTLTKSMYKFKITFRQSKSTPIEFKNDPSLFLDQTHCLLLEDRSNEGK
ncbi:MAG: heat-inducible transcriptional repressor HrcA [Anaerolineae bacterium]